MDMIIFNPGLNKSLQLAEVIKEYIKSNALQQGDKLPSIAQFASIYSVGKDSVNEAMAILSYDGTVVIKPRHGVFVAGDAWKNLYPMSPEWHNYTSRSPQELNSETFAKLHKKISASKVFPRSLSSPLINSNIFPDIVKNGLHRAAELSAKKDLDIWFTSAQPLREKLCDYMESYGLSVSPDQVILMTGVIDAINAICVTTMHPGMELIYGAPSWVPPKKRLASYGISMTGVEMDREGITKDAVLRHLKGPSKKMLYTAPCFSNPSGITMSLQRREELLNICRNAKTPIIEIDSYRELSNDLPPPIAALDNSDSVIYVGSIRDILPSGCSISWIVAPSSIIDRFHHYTIQSDFTSRFTQLFFYSILESGEFYRYRDIFHRFLGKRREFTERILTEYLGDAATWDSEGHPLIYWVKMNEDIDIEKIYASNDLFLYRGSEYNPGYDHHLTISSMNLSQNAFIKSIKRLSEIVRS